MPRLRWLGHTDKAARDGQPCHRICRYTPFWYKLADSKAEQLLLKSDLVTRPNTVAGPWKNVRPTIPRLQDSLLHVSKHRPLNFRQNINGSQTSRTCRKRNEVWIDPHCPTSQLVGLLHTVIVVFKQTHLVQLRMSTSHEELRGDFPEMLSCEHHGQSNTPEPHRASPQQP